jgi:hypothetical protein
MAHPDIDLSRLELLSLTGCATFSDIQSLAREIKENYSQSVNVSGVTNVHMPKHSLDTTALNLINTQDSNSLKGKVPVKTRGDGNCLFNSMSLALCGKDYMANELRLRTALELALNSEYYAAHPIFKESKIKTASGKEWPMTGLYDAVVFSNNNPRIQHTRGLETKENFQEAVEKEICGTFSNYAWSGIMQIMGLASAVGCNIQLLYPDKRHLLIRLLNATYRARTSDSSEKLPTVTIMWTDINGWTNRDKELQVNHFVPCLQVDESTSEWITVSKTRKRTATVAKTLVHDLDLNADHKTGSTRKSVPKQKFTKFDRSSTSRPELTLKDFLVPQHTKASGNAKRRRKNPVKSCSIPNHKSAQLPQVRKAKYCEDKNTGVASNFFVEPVRINLGTAVAPKASSNPISSHSKTAVKNPGIDSMKNLNDVLMSNSRKPSATRTNAKRPLNDSFMSDSISNNTPNLDKHSSSKCGVNGNIAENCRGTADIAAGVDPPYIYDNPSMKVAATGSISQEPDTGPTVSLTKPSLLEFNVSMEFGKEMADKSIQTSEKPAFPLKGVDRSFYRKRGELYYKNANRNKKTSTRKNENKGVFEYQISDVKGTLKENIQTLKFGLSVPRSKIASQQGVVAVGEYILQHGPLIPTTELCKVYTEGKGCSVGRRIMAAELYGIISKYLSIMQIHIEGRAFISEKTSGDFNCLASFLKNYSQNNPKLINDKINDSVGGCFKQALQYMDTKRDRDTAVAIMERIASVNYVAGKLLHTKNKRAVQTCRDLFMPNLSKYEDIKITSQVVRNDMTNENQHKLSLRIANKRKSMEILHIQPGRGRILKCEENESLVPLLEYAFMENDIRERGGGGQQSHPRLIDDTLYRTPDSHTDMKKAREIVIAMSNPDFHISLSCCYNYTQNYKKNTLQARRHHDGKGVNAKLSLHNPPRVGVHKFVINTHWSSSNVNYLVDDCEANKDSSVIDSKDAKSIVPADIAPVQKPMKTWKQRDGILPDHDWEQGQTNAVTPMAHLFLESRNVIEMPISSEELILPLKNSAVAVTRTGKAVNLIYLSYYEPETVFRCFNELLFLLAEPSLDSYFRNPKTGKLKQTFCFVVDNGQSEQPSSSLVQMALVRFCKFLNLEKVIQVSFTEYNSKRNFVERVHPQVNKTLSAHGAFSSQGIHEGFQAPGCMKHKENMEHMANAVIDCLKGANFGGRCLDIYRGPCEDQWIFNDEDELKEFLSFTEFNKEISAMSYKVRETPLLRSLEAVWNIDGKFKRNYWNDYTILYGEEKKAAYRDKYTTIVYGREANEAGPGHLGVHRQPLPDYIRWLATSGELHYLPYNLRQTFPVGLWDSVPGFFMPSNCLDLAYMLMSKPTGNLLKWLALLAWVPEDDVMEYFDNKDKQLDKNQNDGFQRLIWKQHKLYKKKKDDLVKMCSDNKIETCGKKYELVERLALADGDEPPPKVDHYNGTRRLPTTTKDISNLSACYLQSIMKWHGMASSGTKDELILRTTLIANNRKYLCFNRERKMFSDMTSMTQSLLLEEKKRSILPGHAPIYTHRNYETPTSTTISSDRPRFNASVQTQWSGKSRVDVPTGVSSVETLMEMFQDLQRHIQPSTSEMETGSANDEQRRNNEEAFLKEGVRVSKKNIMI